MTSISKWQKSFFTKEMNKLREEFNGLKNKIIDFEITLFEWNDDNLSIKIKIENFLNDIEGNKEELNKKKNEIEKIYLDYLWWEDNEWKKEELDLMFLNISWNYEKIDNYYNRLFWLKNDDWILEWWLRWEIEEIKKELIDENNKSKELQIIIEKQLSLATSVWLASAYQNNRKSFFWSKIFWNISFFFSIILMVIIAIWSSIDLTTLEFIKYDNIYQSFNFIFSKIPFILPLVWLALYSSKQQAQNKRLEQEYYHKEALALTYDSYRKEIKKLWNDDEVSEILRKLMSNMIDMTKENPSITLDKINTHNLPISNFNLFNNKKEENE